jgi:hypothetical protein
VHSAQPGCQVDSSAGLRKESTPELTPLIA